jgi:hypothetical protein
MISGEGEIIGPEEISSMEKKLKVLTNGISRL